MLYHLLFPLTETINIFNLMQYITIRSGGALLTSFVLGLLIGPWLIKKFRLWQHGQATVREGLAHHAGKAGTPTMGGILVVGTFLAGSLLWMRWDNNLAWLILGITCLFGLIGLVDDILSVSRRRVGGLPGKLRIGLEAVAGLAFLATYIHLQGEEATLLYFPFIKDLLLPLGVGGFLFFGLLVIIGSANAVNITDGLDGLVSIPAVIVTATLAILCYIVGRTDFTTYLAIAYVPGAGEVTVLCASMVGAILGFLWYNAPPARIFMGDTGSLAIGALMGSVAILIKQEFALLIIGGLFVLEALSVIIQVGSYKLTGKRVFRMAPLHHHFEHLGWPESTIVVRFWIVSLILALVGLATLKLR